MNGPDIGCVLVGGGLASATAAERLREGGYGDAITIVGDEEARPYERPGLSKEYLQGTSARDSLFVHPDDWYASHEVATRFGEAVVSVDPARSSVRLASGETLSYRHLILATGATPRRLTLPGIDHDGIHTLRRIGDADALREEMTEGCRVVVIGAGWIGLEVAAAARLAGADVTVLESSLVPLHRVLGDRLGRYFGDLHRRHGVDLRLGSTVSAIVGEHHQVTGVLTPDELLPADVVVVGVGVTPNTGLAVDAGLVEDNGIAVDERLRTGNPAILAAGDVANAFHTTLGRRVRVEHWDNAIRQGRLAADSVLGRDAVYDWQPYFYTDQYDLGMEYVGLGQPDDDVVVRGDLDSGAFLAFWTKDDVVTAAMQVNVWEVVETLRQVVGRKVPADRIADESVPLDQL
ncbi:MAG TPA: FAD-dependent oxidoreductase [Lapillicoccus sp.]|jgi:3-phenylpropionate/trans-cinnamate dioxygenase ferredoxin reductase subunit|nr:FAD-dependent oxidoreductase [Lapillicoccus sp.]